MVMLKQVINIFHLGVLNKMGKGLLNFFRRDPLVELIERRNKFDEMSHEVRIEIKSYEERGIKEGDKDYQNYIDAKTDF